MILVSGVYKSPSTVGLLTQRMCTSSTQAEFLWRFRWFRTYRQTFPMSDRNDVPIEIFGISEQIGIPSEFRSECATKSCLAAGFWLSVASSIVQISLSISIDLTNEQGLTMFLIILIENKNIDRRFFLTKKRY